MKGTEFDKNFWKPYIDIAKKQSSENMRKHLGKIYATDFSEE